MVELTRRQQEILGFIEERQNEHGLTPTYREIAARFGFSSVNAAAAHVDALIAKGRLIHEPGRARSFRLRPKRALSQRAATANIQNRGITSRRLVNNHSSIMGSAPSPYVVGRRPGRGTPSAFPISPRIISIPIFGSIPAGLPQDTTQEQEGCVLIDVETVGIKPTARTFALKVRGDSMLGKCIMDGDVAVIEHGVEPKTGDVVAALIDGEVTLKTFVMQRGKPFLRAENPKYPDLIPRAELQIQGVMVALIRKRK